MSDLMRCSADPLDQRYGLRPVAHCPAGSA